MLKNNKRDDIGYCLWLLKKQTIDTLFFPSLSLHFHPIQLSAVVEELSASSRFRRSLWLPYLLFLLPLFPLD